MKAFLIFPFLIFFTSASLFAQAYPPEGWTDDVLEALALSEETGRDILIDRRWPFKRDVWWLNGVLLRSVTYRIFI